MKVKFDKNPLIELCNELENAIKTLLDGTYKNKYEPIDSLIKIILQNNGCAFTEKQYCNLVPIMNDSYYLYFVIGAIGNNVNESFDFIDINGTSYLIIFLDKFSDINLKPECDDDINAEAIEFMGKSQYFDIVTKLVNIFISTTTNPSIYTSMLSTTAVANNYRYAPFIIAGIIINNICGSITENDIYGIDYKELIDIINNGNYSLALCGVHKM